MTHPDATLPVGTTRTEIEWQRINAGAVRLAAVLEVSDALDAALSPIAPKATSTRLVVLPIALAAAIR